MGRAKGASRVDACLYVAPNLGAVTTVVEPLLRETTERHRMSLRLGSLTTCLDPIAELAARPDLMGVVIALERGWPGSSHLRFARKALALGRRAWFYWPAEEAVECLDRESLRSYWGMWALCTAHRIKRRVTGIGSPADPAAANDVAQECDSALRQLASQIRPVPLATISVDASGEPAIRGAGLYFRADYWVQLTSGGSYGHTCYVAKELAARTDRLVCLMASRYPAAR